LEGARLKKEDKLSVCWSEKEQDYMINFPLGIGTSSDGHLLHGFLFTDYHKDETFAELLKELESRGYDPKTLKISIEPKRGEGKFESQRFRIGPPDMTGNSNTNNNINGTA